MILERAEILYIVFKHGSRVGAGLALLWCPVFVISSGRKSPDASLR